jgi:hypothetical protein
MVSLLVQLYFEYYHYSKYSTITMKRGYLSEQPYYRKHGHKEEFLMLGIVLVLQM